MLERNATSPLRLRTVFISDIHLGFKGCSADLLLDFLHHVEMDCLFLVGDIIDVWSMQKNMFWPQSHNNVLRTILGKAKRGTKVIFVPGNHDEVFREFDGAVFGNLEIHRDKAKTAVQYIGSFEDAVAAAARKRGVDTVVCGHIHRAEMRDIDGILYCNDGDWVESCTSLVEDMNGQLRLIDWPKLREQASPEPVSLPVGQAA
jgi:UDP-2,3-diacylglucosamine pyrophosphatase LpxH